MQQNPARILLSLTLVVAGAAHSARAEDPERRLEQYGCVLRLPDPGFTWLAEDAIPGATLACRDTNDCFLILIVAKSPRGYCIDARQGAAFEKGMDRQPNIERLGGKLTEFLEVPCYEIRGRLKADKSLTLTRFFAANGFLYNLQAMIPAASEGEAGKFDNLFAAFQWIGSTPVPGSGATPATDASTQATPGSLPAGFAPDAGAAAKPGVQTPPEVQPSPSLSRNPPTQARDDGRSATVMSSRTRLWVVAIAAGGLAGVILSVILLRTFRHGP